MGAAADRITTLVGLVRRLLELLPGAEAHLVLSFSATAIFELRIFY